MRHISATKQPPGPAGAFISGNLAEYEADRLGFLTMLAREYGGIVRYSDNAYLVTEPELIEQVLTGTNDYFGMPVNLLREPLAAERIALWMRQRGAVGKGLHHRAVATRHQMMVEVATAQMSGWKIGQPLDIVAEMERITSAIIARYCFEDDGAAIPALASQALDALFPIVSSPIVLPAWVPTPSRLRLRRAIDQLDGAVLHIAQSRKLMVEANLPSDLLDLALQAGLNDREVVTVLVSMLLAAQGVPAAASAWVWCLVAQHPQVEAKLHTEIDTVLVGRLPRAEDIAQLTYTEQVVREALRLYPPSWLAVRKVLQGCELGGYPLHPELRIILCPYVTQRDPRYWEAPDEFRPERWTEELKQQLPKFAYFPFGGGPRICLGSIMATHELVVTVATIAGRYRLCLPISTEVRPDARRTLIPDRVRLVVAARNLEAECEMERRLRAGTVGSPCAPGEMLFVGDNQSHDVEAARAAGWHAIWVNRFHADADPPNPPAEGEIHNLEQLFDYLD